jgi:hypothetical protein
MKSIAEIKAGILQSVAETEDQVMLIEIQNYINYLLSQQNGMVDYNASRRKLTIEEYHSMVAEARAEYFAGKVISQEDMEKEL